MTKKTPDTEIAIPNILSGLNRSLKKYLAANGDNSGMVAIKTDDTVALTYFKPYASPTKYMNGSKNASKIIILKSLSFNG